MLGAELGCEHRAFEPLQPLLPIFPSCAVSEALGLFQLLGEMEVSSRAQPDDINFHGGREPPPCPVHAPCPLVCLGCRRPGSTVIHHEGSMALKSWHGIGMG